MIQEESVRQYFAGWNADDASKIASLFAEGGTYEDLRTRSDADEISVEIHLSVLEIRLALFSS